MSIAGLTIPPNADVYWNNEAGLGGPYLESEGDTCYFVNERVRWMAHNLTYFAGLLKGQPNPHRPRQAPERGQEGQPARQAHPRLANEARESESGVLESVSIGHLRFNLFEVDANRQSRFSPIQKAEGFDGVGPIHPRTPISSKPFP